MRRRRLVSAFAGVALLSIVPAASHGANAHANVHAACAAPARGFARCHALVVADAHGKPLASASPTGLSPATVKAAYGFPTVGTAGTGQTIAIVDAYDDPSAEADLGTFSSQFGLPVCTTANGCFQKVNQTGGTSYPAGNVGWGLEISLDVQWAHAIAPGAKILLVEASSNSFANLLAAEDYAKAHAHYISNSWGSGEFLGESSYDSHFAQSGVSFFVSAGDSGTPAEYPSSSPNVISVGGTTLHFDGSGALTGETGWADGGGGCSALESATAAQSGFSGYGQAGCGGARATPDVSLDADPASGVSVYDAYGYGGWVTVGGTSASSPMWAARSAVSGAVVDSAYVYGSAIGYRDITSGNNGAPCLVGFDLCSGRGSWLDSGTQAPDFSLSASPSSVTVTQGSSNGTTVTVAPVGAFTGSVSLSASGLPTGVTASFGTNPTTGGSELTFTASSSATPGTRTVTVTGTSGSLTHTTTVSLTVDAQVAPDFSLSVSPSSRTVKHGRSTTYTLTITRVGGFAAAVDLTLGGTGSGTSGSFSPSSTTGTSSTLTVRTTSTAARGTFTLTITGTGQGGTPSHSTTVSLTVR